VRAKIAPARLKIMVMGKAIIQTPIGIAIFFFRQGPFISIFISILRSRGFYDMVEEYLCWKAT
jgi:hypothetical protein